MSDVLPLQPGDPGRLGDHVLEGRLGEGRRGVVFRGVADGPPVAVKLLHTRLGGDPGARAEFLREALAARGLPGTRVARPLSADVAGDWPYVVSELVAGPSLQQMIVATGRGDRATVERLAVGIALGLATLHKAGVAHLDLRPSNVIITPDGPVLTDVGVARALAAGGVPADPGIPSFQAPEQLTGAGVGPGTDLWAWGAVIAAAASGKPPFGEDRADAVAARVTSSEPELHKLPDSVRDLVIMALSKDPFRRPTAETVLQTLLRRGLDLPAAQQAEAEALLAAPVPADPWSSLPPAQPSTDVRTSTGSFAAIPAAGPIGVPTPPPPPIPPADSGDPFAGPYLPPAPERSDWPMAAPAGALPALPEPAAAIAPPPSLAQPQAATALWERPPASPPAGGTSIPAPARAAVALFERGPSKKVGALALVAVVGIVVLTLALASNGGDKTPAAQDGASTPATPSAAFSGTWEGMATNQSGARFSIRVTFNGEGRATAKLGVGSCVGKLTKTGGEGGALNMSFKRTSGQCTPGTVTMTDKGDGGLQYLWEMKPGSGRRYEALLKRP
ncbi:serine/threonine protein kinase [Actinocorallia herbida]|uniref:non-specific serine/threonine protein kinase n=1 Tax=Actinocorallia herbida TaxID=58109 RepID=A0A3N1DBH2_9ACTN|nr:serine/threonine-protein kinase [Actinocorallia herbida]ROO90458.1 serine/threonine protein kinase [Actinocorallia herbida]